jgi:hypothetical protein
VEEMSADTSMSVSLAKAAASRQAGHSPPGEAPRMSSAPHLTQGEAVNSRRWTRARALAADSAYHPAAARARDSRQNPKRTSPVTVRLIRSPNTCSGTGLSNRFVPRTATVMVRSVECTPNPASTRVYASVGP